jgi:hypothetical protein
VGSGGQYHQRGRGRGRGMWRWMARGRRQVPSNGVAKARSSGAAWACAPTCLSLPTLGDEGGGACHSRDTCPIRALPVGHPAETQHHRCGIAVLGPERETDSSSRLLCPLLESVLSGEGGARAPGGGVPLAGGASGEPAVLGHGGQDATRGPTTVSPHGGGGGGGW